MKNLFNINEKIKSLLFANSDTFREGAGRLPDINYNYVIVIDAETGKPQSFCINSPEHMDMYGLGVFVDAIPGIQGNLGKEFPVEIFDQETALYLIGQSAIHRTLDSDGYIQGIIQQSILITIPVFGGMIPNCLTLNPAK